MNHFDVIVLHNVKASFIVIIGSFNDKKLLMTFIIFTDFVFQLAGIESLIIEKALQLTQSLNSFPDNVIC